MNQYGLIGKTLKHSFSKKYFTNKFEVEQIPNCMYDLYELESIDQFNDLIIQKNFIGLNVTIPYKEKIIPFLHELSDEAREIGAVNTIRFRNGVLKGFNTDVMGFKDSLFTWLDDIPKGALILGTGGASKAVRFVLNKTKVPFLTVSRSISKGDITYEQIDSKILEKHPLLINTTPLGTYPNLEEAPDLPYHLLSERNSLYDLIYNPEKTLFLLRGEERGCAIKNGLEMLVAQAEYSWKIWNNPID